MSFLFNLDEEVFAEFYNKKPPQISSAGGFVGLRNTFI